MTGERTKLFISAALGVMGAATLAFAAQPDPPMATATQAERACASEGITRYTMAYEQCVSRVTRAFEWGEPEMAYTFARIASDARSACLSYGIEPQTVRYEACVSNEMDARSLLVFTDEQLAKDSRVEPNSIAHAP
jgi:hypothetical protein